ncbi:MAG: D-alanine--D-alanine ligase, partial [Pseudanabaenaceae cyanobacterium bins.68]|nr:D-alanine--D-alanine ligase [Pseudanabaenaceae cyanobacterium bins.68]
MAELRIGLIFGGQSGEHQVSIASARAVAQGLGQYQVQPFYIQADGCWAKAEESAQVLAGESVTSTASDRLPSGVEAIDLWFPVLHGPYGEDGTVQGLLELLQKPYVGNGVLASAVGMDKILMKSCFAQAGLAQVKYLGLNSQDWQAEPASWSKHIELHLGYPCFVKP